ncbi:hypothetical protein BS78_K006700, partial [Paspalum vaginatum]
SPQPPVFSFSFDFSNASSYDPKRDLYFEGNAFPNRGWVDLTCDGTGEDLVNCAGRMSFITNFTFSIDQVDDEDLGEGIAFFLSSYPSKMPPESYGENLGLLNSNDPVAYGSEQFVAVEFTSNHDLNYSYIGININSLSSFNTTRLPSNQSLIGTWIATIKFNNITSVLVASLRSFDNATMEPLVVSRELQDIKTLLPQEVAVGFSASIGYTYRELNKILAWSFNSTLAPPPPPPPTPHNKKGMSTARTPCSG